MSRDQVKFIINYCCILYSLLAVRDWAICVWARVGFREGMVGLQPSSSCRGLTRVIMYILLLFVQPTGNIPLPSLPLDIPPSLIHRLFSQDTHHMELAPNQCPNSSAQTHPRCHRILQPHIVCPAPTKKQKKRKNISPKYLKSKTTQLEIAIWHPVF